MGEWLKYICLLVLQTPHNEKAFVQFYALSVITHFLCMKCLKCIQYSILFYTSESVNKRWFYFTQHFPQLLHIFCLVLSKVKFCINYVCANYRLLHFDNCFLQHCLTSILRGCFLLYDLKLVQSINILYEHCSFFNVF